MTLPTHAPILRSAALQRALNVPLRRAAAVGGPQRLTATGSAIAQRQAVLDLTERMAGAPGGAGRTTFAAVLARVAQTGQPHSLQPHGLNQQPFSLVSRQAQAPWTAVPQRASISLQGSQGTPLSLQAGEGHIRLPFGDLIAAAATRHGIEPALLAAVAKQESGFNPEARSKAGAKGLMQLMDATARGLGVQDPFDPAQSLDAGARFLGGLLHQFDGDVRLALAAYNAGPGAVKRYGGVPPYQETQRYVPKVLALANEFRRIWADPASAITASGQTS